MKGTVVFVNPRNGFVIVQVDGGDYCVLELLGGYDVTVGDVLSGRLAVQGGESVRNETQGETVSVFIQGVHCSASTAQAMADR